VTRTARLLTLFEVLEFVDRRTGEVRSLADPHGPPSGRQLLALWHMAALAVVHPDNEKHDFTKAQAAWAIDWLRGDG
jgi:hypothetical protein